MEKKRNKFSYGCYRVIRWLVKLFYPRIRVSGEENLPKEPCLVVANHCQLNGPIACELYFPGNRYTWCAGEMMHLKDVPSYAYQDFWSNKPKLTRWFYRILSYIIAPISVCVFNNARTIAVYRDSRCVSTFKNTVRRLSDGANVVVFPEHHVDHNHILCDFQDRFIDIAKLYYRQTGKELAFVPMYIAPTLKTMYIGTPTYFDSTQPLTEERQRIKAYLMEEITKTAEALPPHKVVPYHNLPKRKYPMNTSSESNANQEKVPVGY